MVRAVPLRRPDWFLHTCVFVNVGFVGVTRHTTRKKMEKGQAEIFSSIFFRHPPKTYLEGWHAPALEVFHTIANPPPPPPPPPAVRQ